MNAHAHWMHVLEVITYTAAFCSAVLLANCFVQIVRYRRRVNADRSLRPEWMKAPIPFRSMLAFFVSIAIGMGAGEWSARIAHNDVLYALNTLPAGYRVFVAGRPATDPERVLQILRSLRWAAAHHSHPSHPISVQIVAQDVSLALTVSRDSSDPHEFWVFLPRYRLTSMNEIGRIFTDAFDGY